MDLKDNIPHKLGNKKNQNHRKIKSKKKKNVMGFLKKRSGKLLRYRMTHNVFLINIIEGRVNDY